jgi:hypothetical protein
MTYRRGELIEQRLLGMMLANPSLAAELHAEKSDFSWPAHWEIFDAIRVQKTGDVVALARVVGPDLGAYMLDLLQNESYAPQNFRAYARAFTEILDERKYAERVNRLRPKASQSRLFGAI